MGPVRKTINFIAALSLTAAGVIGTVYLLVFAAGWKGWMIMAAGLAAGLGGYWLWADFINADPKMEN